MALLVCWRVVFASCLGGSKVYIAWFWSNRVCMWEARMVGDVFCQVISPLPPPHFFWWTFQGRFPHVLRSCFQGEQWNLAFCWAWVQTHRIHGHGIFIYLRFAIKINHSNVGKHDDPIDPSGVETLKTIAPWPGNSQTSKHENSNKLHLILNPECHLLWHVPQHVFSSRFCNKRIPKKSLQTSSDHYILKIWWDFLLNDHMGIWLL